MRYSSQGGISQGRPSLSLIVLFLGKSPEIVFYNVDNQEIERIPIDKMTREELNELMVDKGIEKKEKKETDRSEHDEI